MDMTKQKLKVHKAETLFGFSVSGLKQNTRSLLTPVSETVFIPFHMVVSVLLSMLALIIFLLVEVLLSQSKQNIKLSIDNKKQTTMR